MRDGRGQFARFDHPGLVFDMNEPVRGCEAARSLPDEPGEPVDDVACRWWRIVPAAVRAGLGWQWRIVAAARPVPRSLRDPLYRWVARNRYRLFGRRAGCWLPRPADTDRVL